MYTLTSVIGSRKYYISGQSYTPASSGWKKDREGEERLDQTEKMNLESERQMAGVELVTYTIFKVREGGGLKF